MNVDELALLHNYQLVGALLFGIGLVGFFARRNMIVMFLAAELMLQGISVSLVSWSRFHNDWGGQMLVIFIVAIAACEAAIALALMQVLFHSAGNLDVASWHHLRESNQPEYIDREVPEPRDEAVLWPELSPAGESPDIDPTKTPYRTHV